MKIFNTFLLVVCLIIATSCSRKSTPTQQYNIDYSRNGKVNFISANKGLLSISSESTAERLQKAINFAEINALENILFKGIQGSTQENPLIADEVTAIKENPLVLKGLIFENGYKIFVTESEVLETFKGNPTTVIQRVTFDIPALRKFLEKNNIIRKFGL
jgi:hypothetical protein